MSVGRAARIATSKGALVPAEPIGQPTYYSIADIAGFLRVSRGTIRLWEREGLLKPRRTAGKHRLYTAEDLKRAGQIRHLRRVVQLNAAGIRRELGPAARTTKASGLVTATDPKLGRRLRAARAARRLSLAEASKRTGLSISFISAVELSQSGISLVNLYKLAEAYGVTVAGLRDSRAPEGTRILRLGMRPRYVLDGGRVSVEDLIPQRGHLKAVLLEITGGGESGPAYIHRGEEFIYVLQGHLAFWIGKKKIQRYELSAGESLHLRGSEPHRWRNIGGLLASVIWVNVSDSGKHRHGPYARVDRGESQRIRRSKTATDRSKPNF